MIDLFLNRAQLFDDATTTIHYNATGDKGKQLKISDTPDVLKEIKYIEQKKNNLKLVGSDCSRLAEKEGFCLNT